MYVLCACANVRVKMHEELQRRLDKPLVPDKPVPNQRPQNGTYILDDGHFQRLVNGESVKPTCDRGVGDGNVLAMDSDSGPVRNVGILRKAAMRDVEVICDFPQTAAKETCSIGVGDDKLFDVSEAESSSLQVRVLFRILNMGCQPTR